MRCANATNKMEKYVNTRWCFRMSGCECECGKWITACTNRCECERECECNTTNFDFPSQIWQRRHATFAKPGPCIWKLSLSELYTSACCPQSPTGQTSRTPCMTSTSTRAMAASSPSTHSAAGPVTASTASGSSPSTRTATTTRWRSTCNPSTSSPVGGEARVDLRFWVICPEHTNGGA